MMHYLKGKRTVVLSLIMLAGLLGWLLLLILIPITYNVSAPPEFPPNQYWELKSGSRISYWKIYADRDKSDLPVIYLHGGPGGCIRPGSIKLLEQLANEGHSVYLYDQIGGGFSERLENIEEYSVERHLRDLSEIVALLGARKVILIGQSWGAILATQFAVRYPERVAKMVLTGPGPLLPVNKSFAKDPAPDSLNLKPPASTNELANKKVNNLRIKAVRAWAIATGRKLASDREVDAFQWILSQELNKSIVCDLANAPKSGLGGGFYCQIMTLKSFAGVNDYRADLKKLHCPVLILRGQCDNQPWGVTAEYLKLIPGCQLKVIPSAGHMIEIEQPSEYLRSIREFLAETP